MQRNGNALMCLVFLFCWQARADDGFNYFSSGDLDYWSKKTEQEGPKSASIVAPPLKANTQFPWKKYLDPKNDDFFKEGDYTPPAPFMEIARNPSDENIENWYRYLETKNTLTRRLQERLTKYAESHGKLSSPSFAEVAQQAPRQVPLNDGAKRFRLRLYFDSNCPHCQHMLSTTIRELSQLGYWIELRQIDSDTSIRSRIPFPVSQASPAELKQYQISGVPLLLVGDLKQGTYFRVEGYQTKDAVLQALTTESNSNKPKGGQS